MHFALDLKAQAGLISSLEIGVGRNPVHALLRVVSAGFGSDWVPILLSGLVGIHLASSLVNPPLNRS